MSPELILGLLALAGSVVAAVFLFLGTRGKTTADAKAALDARIDQRVAAQLEAAWARIDEVDAKHDELEKRSARRDGAFGRILRAIAAQWPTAHGPDLDPTDIAEVEDTIPTAWIRRNPT